MSAPPPSDRTRVRRLPARGHYDRDTINAIVDEALLAHVGFVDPHGGFPVVQPMLCARIDDTLYLHGSSGSRQMHALAGSAPVCVTITQIDGLVLARPGASALPPSSLR